VQIRLRLNGTPPDMLLEHRYDGARDRSSGVSETLGLLVLRVLHALLSKS
jgi:hypothetical protein